MEVSTLNSYIYKFLFLIELPFETIWLVVYKFFSNQEDVPEACILCIPFAPNIF